LPKFGFGHEWLNHSVEFKRSDGVNTQRMESLWRVLKAWINDHGYLHERWRQEYIDEFCFRHNHGMGNWQVVWQTLFKEAWTDLTDLGGWDGEATSEDVVEVALGEEECWEDAAARQQVLTPGKVEVPVSPGKSFEPEWTGHEGEILLITKIRKIDWVAGEALVSCVTTDEETAATATQSVCLVSREREVQIAWAFLGRSKPSFGLGFWCDGPVVVEGSWVVA
jgi:hypothetical protein